MWKIEKFIVTHEAPDDILNTKTRYEWQPVESPEFATIGEAATYARTLPERRIFMQKELPLPNRDPLGYRVTDGSKCYSVD